MYSVLYPDYLAKDDFKYEKPIADGVCNLIKYDAKQANEIPVSYTHLTLPTNREV